MALEYKDRVADTTNTAGTGTVTLLGAAPAGYRPPANAGYSNGATVRYCIASVDQLQWEVGEGVWNSAGNTISRVTVFASSNAGALVNFGAGVKNVSIVMTAADVPPLKQKISIQLASAFSTGSASSWGKIPVDSVVYDTAGWWDAANKRVVPKIPGFYLCTSRTRSSGGVGLNAAAIGKNGGIGSIVGMDTGGTVVAVEGTDILQVNGTTDYLESWAFSSGVRTITTGADTHFTVYGPL